MTVVGRLSVLRSGFSVIATKMLFYGCIGDFVAKIRYCIITWNTDLERLH